MTKRKKVLTFEHPLNKIVFQPYKTVAKGRKEQKVEVGSETYTFTRWQSTAGEIAQIRNATGVRVATVYLSGENEGNILTEEGKILTKVNSRDDLNPTYELDGKEVYSMAIDREEDQLELRAADEGSIPIGIRIALLEQSRTHFSNRITPWTFIALGAAIGVFQIVGKSISEEAK